MKLQGIYTNRSGLFQVWILLLLILSGLIFSSVLGLFLTFDGSSPAALNSPGNIRFVQALAAIFSFFFPALGLAWLCSESPAEYLSTNKFPSAKAALLVVLGMLLLNPAISLASLLNKQLVLPAFLEQVELWMISKEEEMEGLIKMLLEEKGIVPFISNMVVIALLAAITEEFLFRGAVQRIIEKWTSNHHTVIWGAAIVFSAIHLQFYGFIPRMLLGAYFGYLLYWSRSIWIPVLAHFINNAFAVIASQDENIRDSEFVTGDIRSEHLPAFSIAVACTLLLFYFLCKKLKAEVKQGD